MYESTAFLEMEHVSTLKAIFAVLDDGESYICSAIIVAMYD